MHDGLADDERCKPGAAPVGLHADLNVAGCDGRPAGRGLVLRAAGADEQVTKGRHPPDFVDAAGRQHVFHGVVVLQGTGLAEVLIVTRSAHEERRRVILRPAKN